ncbi:hypothetical protein HU200_015401 [Digitaria exilis]|uniref:DCD domain-containing protein n=1 Tax=Digitaria exilis TaxID=1010633 RepID=A0A835FAW5_9POAL|nr:hypothetical protein HU200_015401 [Digitaria exilis]
MESDSAAAQEWRRKERDAAGGVQKMEVEKEARDKGKPWRRGAEVEEEKMGRGEGYKWEDGGAIGRKWGMQEHQRHPGAVGHRPFWRPRGGGGSWRGGRGGGFQFHGRPWNPQHHKFDISDKPGVYGGAIIICNHVTKQQFFDQKHFALPGYAATFIKKIRAGMLLFLFEHEERKLYGVFEATSDGALNILPDSCTPLCKFRPAQVLFRRVWFCKPLTEAEFSDAIKGNCLHPQMSFLGISYQQVLDLVDLFTSRMIRLQTYQKPKSRVLQDYKISLARTGQEFGLYNRSSASFSRSSSMFCNDRIPLPHSPFMYAKHNGKHPAHKHEPSRHRWHKPVMFKSPDILEKSKPKDADYIPLELDDCNSDSDASQSTLMGTVSCHSTMESNISCGNQVPKPCNGQHNEDDMCRAPVLNQRFISGSETGQNSAFAQIMKESRSKLQAKVCKRKATVQLDELSDGLPPMRACSMAKKVSFSFGANGIYVTSDKASCKPTLSELQQNREAVMKERKEQIGFSPEDTQSKERDASARSRPMWPSFAERLRNHLSQSHK